MVVTEDGRADARYSAWEGLYSISVRDQLRGSDRRSRGRRVVVGTAGAVVVVVLVATAVQALLALVRWDPSTFLHTVLSPAVIVLLPWLAWMRWASQTRITAAALVVRSAPWRTRSVPWADVVEVGPPGRFDEHPVARLASGERLALVGLPVEVARAMVEVTTPPRPAPASTAAAALPEPAPDDDLDGPFRRGRDGR